MNTFTTEVQEPQDGNTTMIIECKFSGEVSVEEAFTHLILSRVQSVNARCSKLTFEIY